ncbi:MAG TPA: LPS export ABC transporter periplasmic protein LptC [Sphingomicrobium sp.]|jgi:lipopolysaccharide export system protein LptC|nr:LPS export ABC transporter periplasmic protein LptC [Sphingomicrobium sp.]
MSEAATRDRAVKQHWAVPGSGHDRLVRWSKVVLPSAVGVLIAVLAVAPLDKRGDVSFILDKKKVENAPERMRVESARYVGADNRGQKFEIVAKSAVQPSSETPIVDIRGMFARLQLDQGPLMIGANRGRYNIDSQQVAINGPVRVLGPDGYRLSTRDVSVNLKNRKLASAGPVSGQMRLGQFEAGQLKADLGSRTIVLDGGARLKIVQGAVR